MKSNKEEGTQDKTKPDFDISTAAEIFDDYFESIFLSLKKNRNFVDNTKTLL